MNSLSDRSVTSHSILPYTKYQERVNVFMNMCGVLNVLDAYEHILCCIIFLCYNMKRIQK